MSKFHINKSGVPAPCRAQKGNCPLGGDETHFGSQVEAQNYADQVLEEEHGLLGKQEMKSHDKEINEDDIEDVVERFNDYYKRLNDNDRGVQYTAPSQPEVVLVSNEKANSSMYTQYGYRAETYGEYETKDGDLDGLYEKLVNNGNAPDEVYIVSDKVCDADDAPRIAGARAVTAYRYYGNVDVEYNKTMTGLNDRISKMNELKSFD